MKRIGVLKVLKKYFLVFLISMVPLIELQRRDPVFPGVWYAAVVLLYCRDCRQYDSGPIYLSVRPEGLDLGAQTSRLSASSLPTVWTKAKKAEKSCRKKPAAACLSRCCCSWESRCQAPAPGRERCSQLSGHGF